MIVQHNDIETMGFLRFGYIDDIERYMKKAGKNTIHGKNINKKVVKNLVNQYIVLINKGYKVPKYTAKSGFLVRWEKSVYPLAKKLTSIVGTSLIKTLNFLQAITFLSSIGKVPFNIYNPVRAKETKEMIKKIKGKSIFSKIGTGLKIIPITVLGLSVFGIYILAKEK